MILVSRFLELFLKLLVLVLLVSFERVLGYPVLFLTVTIAFLLTSRVVSRYILFFVAAWILAVVYQQFLTVSLVLLASFYFSFKLGARVIESNIQRFVSALLICVLLLTYSAQIQITTSVLMYLFVSLVVAVIFLVKVLFAQYGFLGNKLTARYSFLR